MLVPISIEHINISKGHIPKLEGHTLYNHYPFCNVFIRRSVFADTDLFDESIYEEGVPVWFAEDMLIFMKAMETKWEFHYNTYVSVLHAPRSNLKELIKQWVNYGSSSCFAYKNNQKAKNEIYFSFSSPPKNESYKKILSLNILPFRVLILVSPFVIFHFLFFSLFFALFLPLSSSSIIIYALCIVATLFKYFFKSLQLQIMWQKGFRRFVEYLFVAYVINAGCFVGSIFGGIKNRMLYLHPGI